MARTRAMILTRIWMDPDFVALQPATKLVYLALISQPDVNHLGVLSVAYGRWARAMGGSAEWVRGCVAQLVEARFVVIDEETEQLLIRSFLRNDGVCRQPNVLSAAASAVGALASSKIATALLEEIARIEAEEITEKTQPILAAMKVQLKTLGEGFPEPFAEPFPEGFPEPLLKGSENPSGNPLGDRGKGLGVTTEVTVSRARARGTRLPVDFVVTPQMVAWCQERCPGLDGRSETEKFRNYWAARTGQGATKLDWVATWRNWMISAHERLPSVQIPRQARSTTDERVEAALDVGRRLQERADRGEIGS